MIRSTLPLFAAIAVAAGGCSLVRPRPAPPRALPPATVSADELVAGLEARSAALKSFRALAEMHYVGPKDKLGIKEVVVVERPEHLRIEMMSTFGVALQIAADGDTISAFHRGERTFYRGKATTENLSRFTRLDLGLRDIADLLVGLPPERRRSGRPGLSFDRTLGQWRVSTKLADGDTLVLWFDPDDGMLARARQNDPEENARYEASFADYTTVADITVPKWVRFEVPAQGAKIDLRYSDISLNAALDASLFHFEPPPGAKVVDLDQLSDAGPRVEVAP